MKKSYLLVILVVLSIFSLFIGVTDISPLALAALQQPETEMLLISRLPRLISILITGMSMAIAGLIMQQLSQNKFASPSTAGTLEAASLGILVSLILFSSASVLQKMSIAFGFALAGTYLFIRILDRVVYKDALFVPLIGLMLGRVIASLTNFLAYKYDLLQSLNAWLYGDFSAVLKGRYELLYLGIPVTVIAYLFANQFTIAGFGEDFSANLGLSYARIRNIGLAIVALATSVVVLTVGEIPFIGLIVPNLVTLFNGDHVKTNIPYTALAGAIFTLVCDIIGRLIHYPYEISVSLIIGVVGSAVFLLLIMRRKDYA
jgi:iron complex transport system permease protein